MNDCVFCRIVAGEIPSVRLCETDEVLAFMDIAPIVKGHALVIPKAHYERVTDVPPALLHRVIEAVQQTVRAQCAGLGAEGVNIHQSNGSVAGQVVPHVHFHVIPRFRNDGHHWNWRAGRYADADDLRATADRIRSAWQA